MDRRALKAEARIINRTTAPSPYAVTLVFLVVFLALSYFARRSSVGFVTVDLEKIYTLRLEEVFGFSLENFSWFGLIVYLCIELVSIVLIFGYTSYSLRVSRRQTAGIPNLLDGFTLVGKVLALNILIGLLVFLWSLLLIIPGIIAGYRYCMAVYVLLDHPDRSVSDCLRESSRIMKGHKWEFFVLMLSFIGWVILSCIPGVSVYTNPYMYVTQALYYNRLVGYETADDRENASGPDKMPWEY